MKKTNILVPYSKRNKEGGKKMANKDAKNKKQKPPPPKNNLFRGLLFWIIAGIILIALAQFSSFEGKKEEIIYSRLLTEIKTGNIKGTLIVKENNISGLLKDGTKFSTYAPDDPEIFNILREYNIDFKAEPSSSIWMNILVSTVPILLIFLLIWFLIFRQMSSEGSRVMAFTKSRPLLPDQKNRITFDDVAGCKEAKEELQEIIQFLKEPKRFQKLGGKIPKGVLLIGPPGTGKTLLARAVAGEARSPFLSMSGSDFVEMFVGVGASISGDEKVLIKENNQVRLLPISEVIDKHYKEGAEGYPVKVSGLETLGFYKEETNFRGFKNNSGRFYFGGSKWSTVSEVYRHRVEEIYEVHHLGGVIKTTGDHSVFIREKNRIVSKPVREISEGDILVNLPFKVRSSFIPGYGTTHKIKAHRFQKCETGKITVWEEDENVKENYQFALENPDNMSQHSLAKMAGVSQTTVSNWQSKIYSPSALSLKLNTSRTKIPQKVDITPALLLLLGHYTAEGRTTSYYTQFVFGAHEKRLHDTSITLMRDIFNLEPHLEYTEDNALRITWHSKTLSDFFERTCGNGSHNKHIPEFLWELPKEYFLSYLEGFSKGDGYVSGEGHLIISTVSRQLATEVAWLSAMHGIGASLFKKTNKADRVIKNRPLPESVYWTIKIAKTSYPFDEPARFPSQIKKPVVKKIVRKPYDGYVYDFCGCDNEGFFAGDRPVLVHNSRVRDLFKQALRLSPCIVFIDELDAVGRQRFAGLGGGHDEREQTLNQLLVQMDGFQTETGVIVMAATNRPDVLDPALTRPGRFDRTIVVTLPDIKAREEILNLHMRKKPMADSVDIKVLARATAGLSGANLENLANEAALLAARKGKDKIEMTDLEEAKDKVLMGVERRSLVISEGEKRIIAYHEAGHTLVQKQLPEVYPVHKVTIIPRGQALGITHILPEEDSFIESDTYYRNSICTLMAGRSAEKLVFDKVFTGAENDLKVATEIARKMVCEWGMSKNLGPVSYHHNEAVFLGRDIVQQKEYSEETSREIDSEIRRILEEAEKNAMEILKQHRDKLDKLATELLKRETLNSEEIDEVLGLKPSGETSKPLETVDKASHLPLFPEVKEEENKGEKETNGPE